MVNNKLGQVMLRGIRGAVTVKDNVGEEIIRSTEELVKEMAGANKVKTDEIAAVFFSLTPDLNQVFPAEAARLLGWKDVPLFCSVEIDVPGAIKSCIRIMMLVNTSLKQGEIKHIYLREAKKLREDLDETRD